MAVTGVERLDEGRAPVGQTPGGTPVIDLTWWHWPVPIVLQLVIVAIIGAAALSLAVLEFRVTE